MAVGQSVSGNNRHTKLELIFPALKQILGAARGPCGSVGCRGSEQCASYRVELVGVGDGGAPVSGKIQHLIAGRGAAGTSESRAQDCIILPTFSPGLPSFARQE